MGGAAGVSFDETQKKLGSFDQMKPKIKRVAGVSLLQLLTRGDIDVAVTLCTFSALAVKSGIIVFPSTTHACTRRLE